MIQEGTYFLKKLILHKKKNVLVKIFYIERVNKSVISCWL